MIQQHRETACVFVAQGSSSGSECISTIWCLVVDVYLGINHQLQMPLERSHSESCLPMIISKLYICSAVTKQAHTLYMPLLTRHKKAGVAYISLMVHISFGIDHELQALELPICRSQYECCFPILISNGDIRVLLQKQTHAINTAI
jgi:predicted nucleotide-binding protein (sugar kinase/HSP70/actin superfamily)